MKIGESSHKHRRFSSGIANVILPFDIDRAAYVRQLKNEGVCCILANQNDIIRNVRIVNEVIDSIEIPLTPNELGTEVIYNVIPKHSLPIIIGTLNKISDYNFVEENTKQIKAQNDSATAQFDLSANNKAVSLSLDSDSDGVISINCSDRSDSGKILLSAKGSLDFKSSNETNISAKYLNIKVNDFVNINNASENAVKGNTLKEKLSSLIDEITTILSLIQTITVISPESGLPTGVPINAAAFQSSSQKLALIKNQLNEILSKALKLD